MTRPLIFGFLFIAIVGSSVIQYIVSEQVSSCSKLNFPMLSFLFIIISIIPPMFYRLKRMRSFIVLLHILTSLTGSVLTGATLAEITHLEVICAKKNEQEYNLQLVVVILFNLATVAGHFMSPKSKTSTDTEIELQNAEEGQNLLRKLEI